MNEEDSNDEVMKHIEEKYLPVLAKKYEEAKEDNPELSEEEYYKSILPQLIDSIMSHDPNDPEFENNLDSHFTNSKISSTQDKNQDNQQNLLRAHLDPDQYKRFMEVLAANKEGQ